MLPEQALIDQTKGFLDPEEGQRLYTVALEAGTQGACLEIGGYCGKSALYIGSACKASDGILFSIDHHGGSEEQQPGEEYFDADLFDAAQQRVDTFPHFRRAIAAAGLEDTVVPLVCHSHTAARLWKTPLAMLFIDGGHALETVFADYNAWVSHVIPGGYLLIHDIFPDPADGGQAPYQVYQLARSSGLFEELPMTRSLGVLRRRPTTSPHGIRIPVVR